MEGVDEQQIDVAAGVAIAARGGAENVPIYGFGVPGSKRSAQALPQLKAKTGQMIGDGCSNMIPIKFVDEVAPHHLCSHDALLNKASEATPDAHL